MRKMDTKAEDILSSTGWLLLAIACLQALVAETSFAQTNLETNAGVQFNFSTPGAANLALGGAFLAIADDATAAYTNPAGLTKIIEPEAHVESRSWSYTHLFTDRGRVVGEPTNCLDTVPIAECPDTIAGRRDGEAEDRVSDLSFVSYVYPRRQWTTAFYWHNLARFEANFNTQGAYLATSRSRDALGYPDIGQGRLASLKNRMSLDIENLGVATAYRVNRRFSIGLGLSYFRFDLDSRTERFLPDLFELEDFSDPLEVTSFQLQSGQDSDWALNLGFLWESLGQLWSVGGVYRQGPEFDFRAQSRQGPRLIREIVEADQQARLHVPEVYGLGLAYRPTQSIRVTFDWVRVGYQDLMRDFVDIFGLEDYDPPRDPQLENFRIDDADELHLGFELFFLRKEKPYILRAGAWYEPNHNLRYVAPEPVGLAAIYPDRDDELHYTAGIGISRQRYRLDVGYDYSERFSTVSASAAFRFKRSPKRRPVEE